MTISPTPPGTPSGAGAALARTGELVGQRLGGFLLESLLGAGGMAEVYCAREVALDREVAVKVLPEALSRDPDYVRRFRTEAKRFAALEHPHIVPVYHFDEEGSLLYLVMPILKESLRDRLVREGRLEPEEAIRLVGEVASALQAAHAQGLVHRDVKPENVLLDEAGRALLTDFGIARHITYARQGGAQTLSGTGLPVGTPEYMAPEQLRNEGVDQRADIYALGALLYALLTGRAPHEAGTPYEVAALVLTARVTPPSARNPQIWPALERVVLTALAYRPEDRYADAASFAAALQEALAAPLHAPRDASAADGSVAAVGTVVAPSAVAAHASRPLDLSAVPEEEIDKAPTVPAIAIVRPAVSARILASLRRMRVALATAVALLLLTALGGGALLLAGGSGSPSAGMQTIILAGSPRIVTATSDTSATAAALATAIAQQTPGTRATATARATQTTQTAQPTTLTIAPTPLVLNPQPQNTHTCSATQTITNNTAQALGWSWQKPAVGGFHFQVNGGPQVDWPNHGAPGIASGASDLLTAISDCKPQPQSFAILMIDIRGNQYTFVLQVQ